MTQIEFERALARSLKSIFDNALEGLFVVCAKIEALKIFADSMVED